jgi:RimJ/RimL family protein N-acetyltransferase
MNIPIEAPENRLSDGVILLAPFAPADAVTIMKWDADPDVQHWYDWPLTPPWNDPETYQARLAHAERVAREQLAAWDARKQFAFVIHAAESGEGLGWIDVQPRGQGRANIAYGVLREHTGNGVATRSVQLICRYAFDVLELSRLEICTIADNAASRRVAVKAGFQLEGLLRSYGAYERYDPLLGQRFDWAVYGRLRDDHRQQR